MFVVGTAIRVRIDTPTSGGFNRPLPSALRGNDESGQDLVQYVQQLALARASWAISQIQQGKTTSVWVWVRK